MLDMIFSDDIENEYDVIEVITSNLLKNIDVYGFEYEFNEEQCGFDFKKCCIDPPNIRLGLLVTDDKISNIIDRFNLKLYYKTNIETTINKTLYIPFYYTITPDKDVDKSYFNIGRLKSSIYIVPKSKKDKAKLKLIF